MQWSARNEAGKWAVIGPGVRVLKALGGASIFWWLSLPLVMLSTCAGAEVKITGYQALRGVAVPAAQYGLPPGRYPCYGQDWWVVGLMLCAVIAIASALRSGLIGSAVGLGSAIVGFILLQPAIGFFEPPTSAQYWTPESADGGSAIGFAFFGLVVLELTSMATRSWFEVRRGGRQSPHVGDWTALGCVTTAFLILIGLAILGLVVLALLLRR